MTESGIFAAAFALMLVIEGILPFVAPGRWRGLFRMLTEMSDSQIRLAGLTSMIVGLAILLLAH
jgi:uncharacterized protein YjeT (DUF2065 family)